MSCKMGKKTYFGINKNQRALIDDIFDKGYNFKQYQDIEIGYPGWQDWKGPISETTKEHVKSVLYNNDNAKLTCNIETGSCHVSIHINHYYMFNTDKEFLKIALASRIETKPREKKSMIIRGETTEVKPFSGIMDESRIVEYFKNKGWVMDRGYLRKYTEEDKLRIVISKISFRIEKLYEYSHDRKEWKHIGGGYYKDYYINDKGMLTKRKKE